MLTDGLEKVYSNYYNQMVSQCQSKLKDDWSQADIKALNSKEINGRLFYLRKWFGCHLCQLLMESCPVFQKTLHGEYS
jgi:hypothetical protein